MIPVYDAEAVRRALPMSDAIDAVRWAYIAVATGLASMPPRLHLTPPNTLNSPNVTLVMPSSVAASPDGRFPASLAVKTVSVYPGNPAHGLAAILGGVLMLDPNTGAVLALLDGTSLTAIRTGAGSGAATEVLARSDAHTLAIIGAGGQAEMQIAGICAVRPITQIRVYSRSRENAVALAERVRRRPNMVAECVVVESAEDAIAIADIICTATGAKEPLFEAHAVRPGTHINAIGAHHPAMRELPAGLLTSARLFCDQRVACLTEAGDYLQAIQQGMISAEHIEAEIGQVLNGTHPARQSAAEITVFKSVGLAAQDAVCGIVVLYSS